MAVNKCNIAKLALEQYNHVRYGTTCSDDSIKAIVENYIKYINCADFDQEVCFSDDCSNPTIISDCLCEVIEVTENVTVDDEEKDLVYSLGIGNYSNCDTPFSYQWEYPSEFFDLVGTINDPELKLKLKPNLDLEVLEFFVIVSITDASGCLAIKRCFHVSEASQVCDNNYVACVNPGILAVSKLVIK